jgi:hypothetical protein
VAVVITSTAGGDGCVAAFVGDPDDVRAGVDVADPAVVTVAGELLVGARPQYASSWSEAAIASSIAGLLRFVAAGDELREDDVDLGASCRASGLGRRWGGCAVRGARAATRSGPGVDARVADDDDR